MGVALEGSAHLLGKFLWREAHQYAAVLGAASDRREFPLQAARYTPRFSCRRRLRPYTLGTDTDTQALEALEGGKFVSQSEMPFSEVPNRYPLQRSRIAPGQLRQLPYRDILPAEQGIDRKGNVAAESLHGACAAPRRESGQQGRCRLERRMRHSQRQLRKGVSGDGREALGQTRLPGSDKVRNDLTLRSRAQLGNATPHSGSSACGVRHLT